MSEISGDDPPIRRVRTSRSELAKVFQTPRLIKEFEDLTANVQEVLPSAIASTELVANNALVGANEAQARGDSARAAVDRLAPTVQALETATAAYRGDADLRHLSLRIEQLEVLTTTLLRANSEIPRLEKRLAALESLVIGA